MRPSWFSDIAETKRHYPCVKYWREEDGMFVNVVLSSPFPDDDTPDDDPYIYEGPKLNHDETAEVFSPLHHQDIDFLCPEAGCAAPMVFVEENASTGQPRHWKARNNLDHAGDCRFKNNGFDVDKGLLVRADFNKLRNPNTAEAILHQMGGRYARYNERHPALASHFAGLRRMETFRLKEPGDLTKLFTKAGLERAQKSVFQINDLYYTESEFFIRRPLHGEANRFLGLYNRLTGLPADNHIPCIMQFHCQTSNYDGPRQTITSQSVFLKRKMGDNNTDGALHFLRPRAVAAAEGVDLRKLFDRAGDYIVEGYARLGKTNLTRNDAIIHDVEIEIKHACQVLKVDMAPLIPQPVTAASAQPCFAFDFAVK